MTNLITRINPLPAKQDNHQHQEHIHGQHTGSAYPAIPHKQTNHQPPQDHHHDHQGGHENMIGDFKKRFWISLAVTGPILILTPMIQMLLGIGNALRFKGVPPPLCRNPLNSW